MVIEKALMGGKSLDLSVLRAYSFNLSVGISHEEFDFWTNGYIDFLYIYDSCLQHHVWAYLLLQHFSGAARVR